MATEASPSNDTDPWYAHPVYTRYWQHYSQAMAWMQSHQRAYRKALESYFYSPWCFPHALHPSSCYADPGRWHQPFSDHRLASQDSYCTYTLSKESGRHPHGDHHWVQASAKDEQALSSEEEMVSESDEEVECDLSNMEITEELRQYFAQTERHREERRRQQQLDAERLNDYVNADHDLYYVAKRSTEPPSERPGERRQAEMKQLYGASAAKIQAMEAAVQLSFNKHCDLKRPKYWPVIPLKF